jgi:hypothetical protein
MPPLRRKHLPALAVLLLVAAPLAADDDTELKNQIVVFGGMSILDTSEDRTFSFPLPLDGGRGVPVWPGGLGRLGWPGPGRDLTLNARTRTSLGNSVLFGVRYSRYLKKRLAVEADLAVGPSHDLETDGELCLADRCLGGGELSRIPVIWPPEIDFPRGTGRRITGWRYGGGLAYDIVGGDVRPVLVFGAGGVSWSGSGRSETDFELRFGAGLKILFGRVGARVDVIDHLVLDHFLSGKSEHDIHVTAGLLVGF